MQDNIIIKIKSDNDKESRNGMEISTISSHKEDEDISTKM